MSTMREQGLLTGPITNGCASRECTQVVLRRKARELRERARSYDILVDSVAIQDLPKEAEELLCQLVLSTPRYI